MCCMSFRVTFCSCVFSPFSIAITSLGEGRANLSAFRTFVRFVLVWIRRFPLPLGVWCWLRFVGFLFLLGSVKGCGLWLWHSLDFFLTFFPMLYWFQKLHKRLYKARFIANSSSCTTTVLSKLLTSCLTAVKKHWIRYYDTVYERDKINYFGQLKIPMKFSINFNLKPFRLLNCLRMIFLHCILRYLIIL